MIFIITSGEYSDRTNVGLIEGEGDLQALFNVFREEYIPNFGALRKQYEYPRHIPNWYELIQTAEKKMITDGLISESTWSFGADGFIEWLVRNHGFKVLVGEDFGANMDDED